jgi:hypothetical protein
LWSFPWRFLLNDRAGNIFRFRVINYDVKGRSGRLWCGMRGFRHGRGTGWLCGRAVGFFEGNWRVLLLLLVKDYRDFDSWCKIWGRMILLFKTPIDE